MLANCVRWLYEILFSLYIAGFVVTEESLRGPTKFIKWLAAPLFFVDELIFHGRGRAFTFPRGHSELVSLQLNLGLIIFVSLILFACLRLVNQNSICKALVDYLIVGFILAEAKA